jgi:hypothetical protein
MRRKKRKPFPRVSYFWLPKKLNLGLHHFFSVFSCGTRQGRDEPFLSRRDLPTAAPNSQRRHHLPAGCRLLPARPSPSICQAQAAKAGQPRSLLGQTWLRPVIGIQDADACWLWRWSLNPERSLGKSRNGAQKKETARGSLDARDYDARIFYARRRPVCSAKR